MAQKWEKFLLWVEVLTTEWTKITPRNSRRDDPGRVLEDGALWGQPEEGPVSKAALWEKLLQGKRRWEGREVPQRAGEDSPAQQENSDGRPSAPSPVPHCRVSTPVRGTRVPKDSHRGNHKVQIQSQKNAENENQNILGVLNFLPSRKERKKKIQCSDSKLH